MISRRRALLALALGVTVAGCQALPEAPLEEPKAAAAELIFVAGGSGRVGRYIVARLERSGRGYRALTRSRAAAIERWGNDFANANWTEGDVRNAAQMRAAMVGATSVISVVGSRQLSGDNSAEFVDYRGVANLVDAAKAAGVRHFVLLTAIGVTDTEHPFNKATRGALEWRYKGEEYLRDSGLPYTIVRPAGLQDRPANEQALWIEQGDNWKPFLRATLARDDLAAVLIEVLNTPSAINATFEIANDPDKSPGDSRALLETLVPDSR